MKIIKNLQTDIQTNDKKDVKIKYSDLISAIVNEPVQGGFSLEDISKRLRIDKVCKEAGKEIKLEDEDFNYLKGLAKNKRWGFLSSELLEFHKKLETL